MNEGRRNEDSRIDKLEEGLYSRNPQNTPSPQASPFRQIRSLSARQTAPNTAPTAWQDEGGDDEQGESIRPFTKKLLWLSLGFFVICVVIAGFIYSRGVNVISTENVDIAIAAPLIVAGGERFTYDIAIQNQNNVELQSTSLKIEYPEGARNPEAISEAHTRSTYTLNTITPGMTVKQEERIVFFGEEKTKKRIQISVEYRVAGSNAIYEKKKDFEVELGQAPVSMTVSSLKELSAGQDISFEVTITSNSTGIIQNMMVKADYPQGFTFKNAEPKAFIENSLWRIGDLQPGAKRTIKIQGALDGTNGEEKNVQFSVGIQSTKSQRQIDPVFFSHFQTIILKQPFVGADLFFNGDTNKTYITQAGQTIRADMIWQNNLPTKVTDLRIEAKLNGIILDKDSLSVERGFYRSADNTIIWDKTTDPQFAEIVPGSQGRATFNFALNEIDVSQIAAFKNPQFTASVTISGNRIDEFNVPQRIESQVVKTIKISSDLSVAPRIVYNVGPFKNTGPIPPKADQETFYTIIFAATNGVNDVRNVKVRATLPSYVRWVGAIDPSNASITYSESGGVVEWNVGDMKAGTGLVTAPRQVAFQIAFLPSISQVGAVPVLVNDPTITGDDQFTTTLLSQTKNDLTTRMNTDPQYQPGFDTVIR